MTRCYTLSPDGERLSFDAPPAQLPPGWRVVTHAEYMAAWARDDAALLAVLRVRWEKEAWERQLAEWRAQAAGHAPVGVEL